ncbi:MAG: alkaline phosphatase family protein [Planctomycetota bacterium]|jgi:hypothetical protein
MGEQQGTRRIGRRDFIKAAVAGAATLGVSCALPGIPRMVRTASAAQPGDFTGCRLVVFGSDSLGVDYARTLSNEGAPALGYLGSINPIICSLNNGLSCTQPGWATIWTGMPSYYTRVYANPHYEELPKQMHIMRKIYAGYKDQDLFLVWVTGKGHQLIGKKRKLYKNTPDERVVKGPHFQVKELINGRPSTQPGVYHGDVERENLEVYQLAYDALLQAISHYNFCCFVQFQDPDRTGHLTNDYYAYMEAALEVDNYIFDLMGLLPADTNIVYCSDHGFDFMDRGDTNLGHRYSPSGMLATNFPTASHQEVDMCSVGRLIYRVAGGDPEYTKYIHPDTGIAQAHRMYGIDLL